MIVPQKILVLSPHPDDGEFGCGANIARFVNEGAEVYVHVFSLCGDSLPKGFTEEDIRIELIASWNKLGVPEERIQISNYKVRRFDQSRQEILEELIQDKENLRPDTVFVPATSDIHQDHQVVANEGFRVFKHVSVFGYELIWNSVSFSSNALLGFGGKELDLKLAALKSYQSQSSRQYFDPDFIRSLAKARGVQGGQEFAEAFEIRRLVHKAVE